jgi:NAD(P)-dependent dehydrogenase (short-subunit alcohol dehydrogenase family)
VGLLDGKVAIVSGIGPGLGIELARAFAREGADVALGARTESALQDAAAEVEAQGRKAYWKRTDITKPEDCRALVAGTVEALGKVDILANNAFAYPPFLLIEDADFTDWQGSFDVNLFGTLNMCQAVIPPMRAQGGGAIVNVNSMIQKKVLPYQAGYAASKGALTAATRSLAKELGGYGIRVNQTYMGWMWGPPVEGYVNGQAEALGVPREQVIAEITKDIPLGIIPDDADCANAVIFLASDLAKVITGSGLDVNGGEWMS